MDETIKKRADVIFRCDQCGREGAEAIFTCPKRPSSSCLFVEEERRKEISWFVVFGVIGLLIIPAIVVAMVIIETGWIPPLVGLLITLGWFFFARTERVQLFDPVSGVRLHRTTLLGNEIRSRWNTPRKLLPIELKFPEPLSYPPSIITFSMDQRDVGMVQALAILRAALIGLLAEGHIQVYHFQSYVFKMGRERPTGRDTYLIEATKQIDKVWTSGILEKKIDRFLARRQARVGFEGLPIYDLVRGIYGSDQDNPDKWLAKLVAGNATGLGLGRWVGGIVRKQFEWNTAHAHQLKQEQEIMKALSRAFFELHPDLRLMMDKQIRKGIKSRKREHDYQPTH